MRRRKATSGGQALVLVTLALVAMCGMLGLTVDLGWSFFVEKQAQAAADGAALGAVQEAVARMGASGTAISGFTCSSPGTVDCEWVPVSCASVTTTSNLNNGCKYAAKDWTSAPVQNVTMQSSDYSTHPPPTAPGVVNISYWVTARTWEQIPQLFSAVLGNPTGVVSAVATAGIAGSIQPGSFFGMNRAGDCLTGADAGNCGLDVITGHGKGKGKSGSQACGPNNITSDLCAPSGIILASSCGGSVIAGVCDSPAYAGVEQGAAAVASSLTVMGVNNGAGPGGVSGTWENLSGATLPKVNTTNAATFQDPTAPNPQPPLVTAGSSIGTCALPTTAGTPVTITGTLGPYLYFSYSSVTAAKVPIPDGQPITIAKTATFSQGAGSAGATAACPPLSVAVGATSYQTIQYGSTATQDANFPTYIFLGGVVNNGTMNLGPGQYVMAGTNSTTGSVFDNEGTVDGTSAAAQATGTMFIFTDAAYPTMNLTSNTSGVNFTPLVSGPAPLALDQGTITANGSLTMYGLVNSLVSGSNVPSSLNAYSGVTWWADRRNSNVGYDEASGSSGCNADCTGDNGSVISCAVGCVEGSSSTPNVLATSNHVTATSPGGVQFGNGNTKWALYGVYYQPRGAYTDLGNGNTGFNCPTSSGQCPLQLVTGALFMGNGNTRMVLAGPTNPILTYKATLIQ